MIRLRNIDDVARAMRDDIDARAAPQAVIKKARAAGRAKRLTEFLRRGADDVRLPRLRCGYRRRHTMRPDPDR